MAVALMMVCAGCTVDGTGRGKLPVSIAFVSRHPGTQASPSSLDAFLDLPGVGAHSRLRPASPGKLMVLESTGLLRVLVDGSRPGAASLFLEDVSSPSVSWDGKTLVFAGLHARADASPWPNPAGATPGAWRLYTIGVDGRGLSEVAFADEPAEVEDFDRQLGPAADGLRGWDDFDPVFLPDDRHVVFASTRWRGLGPVAGVRTSNLFIGAVDGSSGQVARLTSERGGAERPVIDPVSGRVAFSRWLSARHLPSDDEGTLLPDTVGPGAVPDIYWRNDHVGVDFRPTEKMYRQLDGLTALSPSPSTSIDSPARSGWQLLSVAPDGTGLALVTGWRRDDLAGEIYGGAFAADGSFVGQFFPSLTLVDAAGFGGLRVHPAGAGQPRGLVGVTTIPTQDLWAPGVARTLYAAEPALLPDGRVLYSQTQAATHEAPTLIDDRTQDYGLYVIGLDGSGGEYVFDLPDTAELQAQPVVARTPPPSLPLVLPGASSLPPRATTLTATDAAALDDAAALTHSGRLGALDQDGNADLVALNVWANGAVDVPMVSAPAVGYAATLRTFADWQRHAPGPYAVMDWPRRLADAIVDGDGFARVTVPAMVPLFQQLRDSAGKVTVTDGSAHPWSDARAQELAPSGAAPNERRACLGCHAGHSLLRAPTAATVDEQRALAAFTNLAPGATVTASSTSQGAGPPSALVDRVAATISDPRLGWRSDATSGVELRLAFAVPIAARSVVLWDQARAAGVDLHVVAATIRLYADAAGTVSAAPPIVTGPLTQLGLVVDVSNGSPQGVTCRTLSITLDQVTGSVDGAPASSLAEVEVVASGIR